MFAVNKLPVRALLNIGLIQKCQTRRRIVQVAKGKRTSARSLWAAWTVGANSLGGRRQPVYLWHPAPESAQDVTQSPVPRGQSRLTFETLVTRLFRDGIQFCSGLVDLVVCYVATAEVVIASPLRASDS